MPQLQCGFIDRLDNRCPNEATVMVGETPADATPACDEHKEKMKADRDRITPLTEWYE